MAGLNEDYVTSVINLDLDQKSLIYVLALLLYLRGLLHWVYDDLQSSGFHLQDWHQTCLTRLKIEYFRARVINIIIQDKNTL